MNELRVGECIRFGWETFKKRPWFFIGVFVLIMVVSGAVSQLSAMTSSPSSQNSIALVVSFTLFSLIINVLIKMGTINFVLKAEHNPESARLEDLLSPHPFITFAIAGLVVGLIVVVGLILLIVPGVIWSIRYMFVPYIVMDRKVTITEALDESGRITKGHKWQLLLFLLAVVGLNILGAICLIVGLLVSIPVTALAFVHAYRVLSKMAGQAPAIPATA